MPLQNLGGGANQQIPMSKFYTESVQELADNISLTIDSDELDHVNGHMKIIASCPHHIEGASMVLNTISRVILADVPTMRIDDIYVDPKYNNVKLNCIPRRELGQMHIKIDPTLFDYEWNSHDEEGEFQPSFRTTAQDGFGVGRRPTKPLFAQPVDHPIHPTAKEALLFELDVKCYYDDKAKKLINSVVTTGHLTWIRMPGQEHLSPPEWNKNVPLYKMTEGQHMCLRPIYALKGSGTEHTKWRGANAWMIHKGKDFLLTIDALDGNSVHYYWQEALRILTKKFNRLADAAESTPFTPQCVVDAAVLHSDTRGADNNAPIRRL